jgi:hypothetical protein
MSPKPSRHDLGEPALRIAGLALWIHGREFPDSPHPDDLDWLRATVHCGAHGASVRVQGAILMVRDVAGFQKQCEAVLRGDADSAVLEPFEPALRVSLAVADRLGHLRARVDITPDHLNQSHQFEFEIDQSWLPGIVRQCSAILRGCRASRSGS